MITSIDEGDICRDLLYLGNGNIITITEELLWSVFRVVPVLPEGSMCDVNNPSQSLGHGARF